MPPRKPLYNLSNHPLLAGTRWADLQPIVSLDPKHGVIVDGEAGHAGLRGCRTKYQTGSLIIKFGQAAVEKKFWDAIEAKPESQFFVPLIGINLGEDWTIQPKITFGHHPGRCPEEYALQAQQLFNQFNIGDFHAQQYGVTPDGLLAIFDYGHYYG